MDGMSTLNTCHPTEIMQKQTAITDVLPFVKGIPLFCTCRLLEVFDDFVDREAHEVERSDDIENPIDFLAALTGEHDHAIG
jgi:hypothetical protein